MSSTQQDTAQDLDARYGRSPRSSRRNKWVFGSTAAAFVAVFAAWLVWGGLLGAPAEIAVEDTGHTVVSDSLVQVRYQLTVDAGKTVDCAVQALNSTFGIVGWKVVSVPPSETRTRSLVEEVRTTELSVTGLIYRCWLT
ncbi:hypothetical protein ABIE21_001789 [Conyzicola nivalis]|uniref:DUF4307 domain-containing protein n=1 Tax=Conyzicola nivalis TaxID=1477021 RepID=A0ABV2QMK0_9MICO